MNIETEDIGKYEYTAIENPDVIISGSKKKELHIYMNENYPTYDTYHSLDRTLQYLTQGRKIIRTTQTHVCSTKWLEAGYRIFVHMLDNKIIEIVLGQNIETSKEIRLEHNLEKLLLANTFGRATNTYVIKQRADEIGI